MTTNANKPDDRPPVIRITDMNKWYGNYHALKDINLDISLGERVVICGP